TSTTAKTPNPRSRIDDKDSCNPSRTIPVRKSFLDEKATPSDMAVGTGAILRHTAPSRIAIRSALMPMTCAPNHETTAATRQTTTPGTSAPSRSEEHTSELQSRFDLVCRLLLE